MAPPPTRGWTLGAVGPPRALLGSPAHAGMDPTSIFAGFCSKWLPRPRGDGPAGLGLPLGTSTAPPPTRGWTQQGRVPGRTAHGSPAHAGMDPRAPDHLLHRRRLPRPRGDGPQERLDGIAREQAPPPTRGWTLLAMRTRVCTAGSPAHAGMDPLVGFPSPRVSRLPRPRGDGPQAPVAGFVSPAAPPPTRGWTQQGPCVVARVGGSPAHAGMGPTTSASTAAARAAPPPTRGWTR